MRSSSHMLILIIRDICLFLMKRGFKGPVYATSGTRDLCSILLPDAGKLQEEEAGYANRKGFS
jgi:metallo-beta-lactamase family protein